MAVLGILDALMYASADDPPWGLRLAEMTGTGTGTLYPALGRMTAAGWIAAKWEEPQPVDRPRRRYYEITEAGRVIHEQAVGRWRQP